MPRKQPYNYQVADRALNIRAEDTEGPEHAWRQEIPENGVNSVLSQEERNDLVAGYYSLRRCTATKPVALLRELRNNLPPQTRGDLAYIVATKAEDVDPNAVLWKWREDIDGVCLKKTVTADIDGRLKSDLETAVSRLGLWKYYLDRDYIAKRVEVIHERSMRASKSAYDAHQADSESEAKQERAQRTLKGVKFAFGVVENFEKYLSDKTVVGIANTTVDHHRYRREYRLAMDLAREKLNMREQYGLALQVIEDNMPDDLSSHGITSQQKKDKLLEIPDKLGLRGTQRQKVTAIVKNIVKGGEAVVARHKASKKAKAELKAEQDGRGLT